MQRQIWAEGWRLLEIKSLLFFLNTIFVAVHTSGELVMTGFTRAWACPKACGMVVGAGDENVAHRMPIQRPDVGVMCVFLAADGSVLSGMGDIR